MYTDTTVDPSKGKFGIGVVGKNNKDALLAIWAIPSSSTNNPTILEACAISIAMLKVNGRKLGIHLGYFILQRVDKKNKFRL